MGPTVVRKRNHCSSTTPTATTKDSSSNIHFSCTCVSKAITPVAVLSIAAEVMVSGPAPLHPGLTGPLPAFPWPPPVSSSAPAPSSGRQPIWLCAPAPCAPSLVLPPTSSQTNQVSGVDEAVILIRFCRGRLVGPSLCEKHPVACVPVYTCARVTVCG